MGMSGLILCHMCLERLPVSDFYLHRTGPRAGTPREKCRPCTLTYNRSHGRSGAHKDYKKRVPGDKLIYERAYRVAHYSEFRRQSRAAHLVAIALKNGTLTRPTSCDCGRTVVRIEGHHPDYSKPLEVEWLCTSCHKARHASLKGMGTP